MTTSMPPALDKEQLRALVAEVLDVDVADVGDRTDFADDLEVDSLMGLEVIVVLEKRYGIRLPETALKEVTCLDRAYDAVTARLAAVAR